MRTISKEETNAGRQTSQDNSYLNTIITIYVSGVLTFRAINNFAFQMVTSNFRWIRLGRIDVGLAHQRHHQRHTQTIAELVGEMIEINMETLPQTTTKDYLR